MWKFLSASEPNIAHPMVHPIEISNFDKYAKVQYHSCVVDYMDWRFHITSCWIESCQPRQREFEVNVQHKNFNTSVILKSRERWDPIKLSTMEQALDYVKDFINNELQ